jgi:hypothetical protein
MILSEGELGLDEELLVTEIGRELVVELMGQIHGLAELRHLGGGSGLRR